MVGRQGRIATVEAGAAERVRLQRELHDGLDPFAVELEAPQQLPTLSPAVELAAYGIANEALANVLRHSDASHCQVRLSVDVVTVRDDDNPPQSWRAGVGLRSISNRPELIEQALELPPGTADATRYAVSSSGRTEEVRPIFARSGWVLSPRG